MYHPRVVARNRCSGSHLFTGADAAFDATAYGLGRPDRVGLVSVQNKGSVGLRL